MRLKPLASVILSAALVTQLTACGTLFYPERRGQINGEIDSAVAVLNAIGLLFYLVPGIVAFAVDFATGAIYLPDRNYSVAPEKLNQAVGENGEVDAVKLKAILKQELDLDIPLEHARQMSRPGSQQLALLGLTPQA
ncbi:MAG TPA: polyribonucleotide nucleotidyltransferase [Pseudomonas xinjiangensis]|uniref:Polyribonucleotide nucleotidyltransferase n=2 Tax=root TaxID=1 RepID=A0A7V1BPG6_9GAMM|nr:polyribonucleotide nucleotidyltransferase [Halopseudomonas xinjiangensis]HEC47640.1 polyribonucleotide nucleotidyltransferase [Halopseudomonas xinjiangensis]